MNESPYNDPRYGNGQSFLNNSEVSPTVTKMDWFLFVILTSIPVVNLLALIYFACDKEKPSRANFALLQLILVAVAVGLFLLFALAFGGCMALLTYGNTI